MTVLILHGIGGKAGNHWQQWLHDELIKKDCRIIMPNLPSPNHPDRKEWLGTIKEFLKNVEPEELIIVGHSLGVVSALDFIEQAKGKINAFISVAGFSKDYKSELNSYFLSEKSIDFNKVKKHLEQSFVIYSDDDPFVPQEELKSLATSLEVVPKIIHNGGHLNTKAGYNSFPYLLDIFNLIN
jgi:uncharacterized protein